MNVEGIFALAFLALLLVRRHPVEYRQAKFSGVSALVLCCIVFAAFARFLDFPFIADDYSHIWKAHHSGASALWAHFTVPEEDRFFRPAGYLSYALDATWAGYSTAAWRASNLLLHLVNCVLVLWLLTGLGFSKIPALLASLIFGLHGSRPEAVTWVAARFDLLAVLFALGCLIGAIRGARLWVVLALLFGALMSKESAYVTPFVLGAILVYQRQTWAYVAKRLWPLLALETCTFAYRTWLLNGIGGYQDIATGRATIFNFGLASSLKAMFLRFWGVLLFPINWTGGLNIVVSVSLCLAVAAFAYLAWRGADRRKALLGIATATLCSLPVQQFLSIGPDLEKSRVLYMASIGLAILFASLFEQADLKVYLCAGCILLFQLAALESNLTIWKRVGTAAERACRVGVEALRSDARPLAALGLPNVLDGVYFLHTGYPECILFQLPEAMGRVSITRKAGAQEYLWNPTTQILERAR